MEATAIPGVKIVPLSKYADSRGWLTELFRDDELPEGFKPAMGYMSVTHAGVARGPHEHADQTDCFAFLSGQFELVLWENRPGQPDKKASLMVGENNPVVAFVPPGVVHAYRNVGDVPGLVVNCPNRLYRGEGKNDPVDEIRHEDDPHSIFQLVA